VARVISRRSSGKGRDHADGRKKGREKSWNGSRREVTRDNIDLTGIIT
jgi:hypothetical protein